MVFLLIVRKFIFKGTRKCILWIVQNSGNHGQILHRFYVDLEFSFRSHFDLILQNWEAKITKQHQLFIIRSRCSRLDNFQDLYFGFHIQTYVKLWKLIKMIPTQVIFIQRVPASRRFGDLKKTMLLKIPVVGLQGIPY